MVNAHERQRVRVQQQRIGWATGMQNPGFNRKRARELRAFKSTVGVVCV
jgi:hypothetical protein